LKAQDPKEYRTWSVTAKGGITNGLMDVKRYDVLPQFGNNSSLDFYFSLGVKKALTPVFGVQAEFGFGEVQGIAIIPEPQNKALLNSVGLRRSIFAENTIYSGSLDLVVNFSNIGFYKRNITKPRRLLFYGTFGIGAIGHEADLTYTEPLAGTEFDAGLPVLESHSDAVDTDGEIEAVFKGGLGLKFKLNQSLDLNLETNYNLVSTDNLDALVVPGTGFDAFGTVLLGITFKLPSKNGATEHLDWIQPGADIYSKIDSLDNELDSLGKTVADHINNTDTDGDGVPDINDKEPYSLFGAEVNADGVAKDADGDGVPDGLDKEPDTPKGELVNYQGIAIKDQIAKDIEPQVTETQVKDWIANANNAYFPSVFFADNSAQVRSAAMSNLVAVATAMQKKPGLKITLTGHADKRGPEAFNQKLAERRAEAVKKYLVRNLGIDASRIIVASKGETEPKSATLNSINRRVDIEGGN